MRVEERPVVVKQMNYVYISDDGYEFRDKDMCIKYEENKKIEVLRGKLAECEIKDAYDALPPTCDADSSCEYHWFLIQTEEQAQMFKDAYDKGMVIKCPEIIGVEYGGFNHTYYYRAEELMTEAKEFWKHLGYDVVFSKKETE